MTGIVTQALVELGIEIPTDHDTEQVHLLVVALVRTEPPDPDAAVEVAAAEVYFHGAHMADVLGWRVDGENLKRVLARAGVAGVREAMNRFLTDLETEDDSRVGAGIGHGVDDGVGATDVETRS